MKRSEADAEIEIYNFKKALSKIRDIFKFKYKILITKDISKVSDGYHTFEELYNHRCLLWINLCLMNTDKAFWRHHYEGWPLLQMETAEAGQMTYHVPEKYLHLFKDKIKQGGPDWDGHTSNDVIKRLALLATSIKGER